MFVFVAAKLMHRVKCCVAGNLVKVEGIRENVLIDLEKRTEIAAIETEIPFVVGRITKVATVNQALAARLTLLLKNEVLPFKVASSTSLAKK